MVDGYVLIGLSVPSGGEATYFSAPGSEPEDIVFSPPITSIRIPQTLKYSTEYIVWSYIGGCPPRRPLALIINNVQLWSDLETSHVRPYLSDLLFTNIPKDFTYHTCCRLSNMLNFFPRDNI